jgi:hypothetical protein
MIPRAAETSAVLFARYGPRYRIYVTVVALLGTISAIVTTTTVNVALPDVMGSFGIGQVAPSGYPPEIWRARRSGSC